MVERFKLALVSPRLDGESAGAQFWSKLLPCLREEIDVELFGSHVREGDQVQSVAGLHPRRYDQVLYVVDDTSECGYMAPMIRGIGGTVDLFSWELPAFARAAWPELAKKGARSFLRAVREGGLVEALEWRKEPSAAKRCFNRTVVRHGDAFIVRDEALGDRVRTERNENTAVGSVRHPELVLDHECDRAVVRRELALPEAWHEAPLVAWFSPLHPRKRDLVKQAAALVRERFPEFRILGVGHSGKSDHELQLVDTSETWRVLRACDVAIHLPQDRMQVTGEVHEALAHGRCVVTSQESGHALPESAVHACEEDARSIADALIPLIDQREARLAAERAASEFMNEERRWQHVARLYAQFLRAFPEPRASRKSLIGAKLREVERRSALAAEE